MKKEENPAYLTSQIITYIGNKRQLIGNIEEEVESIKKELGKRKLSCVDLFSGSGIVARMLKRHSRVLIVNDLEEYSRTLNDCYLTNRKDFSEGRWEHFRTLIESSYSENPIPGILSKNYAPSNDENIQKGERVFYTHENALRIDSFRTLTDRLVDDDMKKFFLAPLLTEASIHVNTSGVFKGFYKDKTTGIGCFGGAGKNALSRILGKVELKKPVLSSFNARIGIYKEDALSLAPLLSHCDLVYLDPPYNQHPYGSNYFMLNLILKNIIDCPVSKVSGITQDWNRSAFNRSKDALSSLEAIVSSIKASYLIVSYNSEGFISMKDMEEMLSRYGNIKTVEIPYPTFRGSRNLKDRTLRVSEYLFVVKKHQ